MKAIYLLATLGLLEQPATVNAANLAAGVPGKWNKLPEEAANALKDAWSELGRLVAAGRGPEAGPIIEELIYGEFADELSGRLRNEEETLSALDTMGQEAAWQAHHLRSKKAYNEKKAHENYLAFEEAAKEM